AAVVLQRATHGEQSSDVWQLPQLVHVQQSGGLILGARIAPHNQSKLSGIVIDLIADVDGYPARRTVTWSVDSSSRNQGVCMRLREIERRMLHKAGVDLVYWDIDPLNSVELHIALNKLGGLITAYERAVSDEPAISSMLSTDRVRVEWWIDSPRVVSRIVHEAALPHQHVGLHEMVVVTRTTTLQTGVRGLVECDQQATSDHVLAEIPENLSDLRARDPAAAIQWRERSRPVLEQLFQLGYQGVGLIHEGGRSFLVMKKGTRRTELGAARER
ncbi:hypothetical protein KAR02_07510, partial [Candidatus Bipolaricaulota bacterium]|nr:hypothetical protein [Candidatus Bipolaricaulota bacterium]